MMKSFIMGSIPLGLFIYTMMFHTTVVVVLALAGAFLIVAFLIGQTVREEFGDLRDKEEY